MHSDQLINIVILSIVGAVLFFIMVTAFRTRRTEQKSVSVPKPKSERLFESKEDIPKLPRNETLYHILKNSALTVNKIGFDPNYVFDEVASLLRNDLDAANTEILFDIAADIPEQLIGSPKRLSRVLINLIENAVQYSDGGVVLMEVSVLRNNGSECGLRYTIRDKGRGMGREELDALLIDPALRAKEGKLPYGYYVATAIVVAEGGVIGIESEPGRGTTVSFDLTFKLPQTHQGKKRHLPSKACNTLKVAMIVRHVQTAEVLKKHMERYVGEMITFTAETPSPNAQTLEGYDMVIIDQQFSDRTLPHTLKSQGVWLIMLQSILDSGASEGHVAADYQLSLPFTHEHIVEMLIVFYGEESEAVEETEAEETQQQGRFDTFVSDADIPVTANVSKKDFARFVGAKLLIVEDNPINQRVIKGLLGDSGILLYFAENGMEALDVVSEEAPFDLVLMDINMPVMDGIETTRRIRTESQFDTMPIVAFTGLNLKDQIERMQEVGMNAHMAKPLKIGRFYSVFNHFLPKTTSDTAA